jgi:hypothetical protein
MTSVPRPSNTSGIPVTDPGTGTGTTITESDAPSREQVETARALAGESFSSARRTGRWLALIGGSLWAGVVAGVVIEASSYSQSNSANSVMAGLFLVGYCLFVPGVSRLRAGRAGTKLTKTGEPAFYDAEISKVTGPKTRRLILRLFDRGSDEVLGQVAISLPSKWSEAGRESLLVWGDPRSGARRVVVVDLPRRLSTCRRLRVAHPITAMIQRHLPNR